MASKQNYNAILVMAGRSVHYGWAQEYINRWTDDPRDGRPPMQWLKQLIDETLAFKID
jgi:indoleamine 2,3-dioxygenase